MATDNESEVFRPMTTTEAVQFTREALGLIEDRPSVRPMVEDVCAKYGVLLSPSNWNHKHEGPNRAERRAELRAARGKGRPRMASKPSRPGGESNG